MRPSQRFPQTQRSSNGRHRNAAAPEVSVVIPTYNRLGQLQRVLEGLAAQDYPLQRLEVVVVSDGSTDGTADYLREAQMPYVLWPVLQANQGVAATRNHGVQQAQGRLLLFLDDDVVPAPQLVAEHVRAHGAHGQQYGDHVVVLGPMMTPPDFRLAPWVAWEQMMLMKQYQAMVEAQWEPTARQFYTGNTSLARQHVLETGGFDPTFRRAEDVELAYRLADRGLHFVFEPQAVGYHYAHRSYDSWQAIPYAYGRNDVIFSRERGQEWLLPTVFYEYSGRNALIRLLTRCCLDRPRLSEPLQRSLRAVAVAGQRLGVGIIPRMAFSAIFNLRHYQGISDELGGRRHFFEGVAANRSEPPRPPGGRRHRKEAAVSEVKHAS